MKEDQFHGGALVKLFVPEDAKINPNSSGRVEWRVKGKKGMRRRCQEQCGVAESPAPRVT